MHSGLLRRAQWVGDLRRYHTLKSRAACDANLVECAIIADAKVNRLTYRDKTEADRAKIVALEQLLAEKEQAIVTLRQEIAPAATLTVLNRKRSLRRRGGAMVVVSMAVLLLCVGLAAVVGFPGYAETWLAIASGVTGTLALVGWLIALGGMLHVAPLGHVLVLRTFRGVRVIEAGKLTVVFPMMDVRMLAAAPRTLVSEHTLKTYDGVPIRVKLSLAIKLVETQVGVLRYAERFGPADENVGVDAYILEKASVVLQDIATDNRQQEWQREREQIEDKFVSILHDYTERSGIAVHECTLSVL